ncbi:MAG: hypothetical protein QME83_17175 [Thermodesulfobacteriota bacterium]|nr:hypothetical protein [Thermodesulfobacteriota bacterium]
MKKFIVLSVVALLVLAFGTMAFAQAKKEPPKLDFKASGFIDIQSFWFRNIDSAGATSAGGTYGPPSATYLPGGGAFDRTNSYMDSRARLKFDAVMGKELSGTIFFEMDSTRWGERGDGRNLMGVWAGDRAALEIKNVYIDFGIPHIGIPLPMTVRVGLQPLAIRPMMVVYTDGMGITGGIKADPVIIAPLWFKAIEGKDASSDDVDVYGLHVSAKVAKMTIGGYGLYYNMNSYPFPAAVLAYGANPVNQADMWWLGGYVDGKLGPVDLNFDFVYDTGKVERKHGAPVRDVDYRGWATRAKVDFPWEKFNFGVVGMYATGSDTRKTSATGIPGTTGSTGLNSTKVGSYVIPPGSESFAVFTESVGLYYPSWVNSGDTGYYSVNYSAMGRGAIGGSWMAKVYTSLKATPWYKATLYGMYIGDTTKHGNTVGTARKAPYGAGNLRDEKTIGWELGLINEINIYKNLKWDIGAGVLFAGDALDYWNGTLSVNDSPKNPWIITTRLAYTF